MALVTGGSRRIGEMTAERLSLQGEWVSIPADLSTMDGITALASGVTFFL